MVNISGPGSVAEAVRAEKCFPPDYRFPNTNRIALHGSRAQTALSKRQVDLKAEPCQAPPIRARADLGIMMAKDNSFFTTPAELLNCSTGCSLVLFPKHC